MKKIILLFSFCALVGCGNSSHEQIAADADKALEGPVNFGVLKANVLGPSCLRCHASNNAKTSLDMSTYENLMSSGVVNPGKPDESFIYQRVAAGEMPPDSSITMAQIQILKKWIAEGAQP